MIQLKLFLIILLMSLTSTAFADFLKIPDGWTLAPNGLLWSEDQGHFSYMGFHAARACKRIGGRLPTREDYGQLIQYFEAESNPMLFAQGFTLTGRGEKKLLEVFPDMRYPKGSMKYFWTSTVHPESSWNVFGFVAGGTGSYVDARVGSALSVRCVKSSQNSH